MCRSVLTFYKPVMNTGFSVVWTYLTLDKIFFGHFGLDIFYWAILFGPLLLTKVDTGRIWVRPTVLEAFFFFFEFLNYKFGETRSQK